MNNLVLTLIVSSIFISTSIAQIPDDDQPAKVSGGENSDEDEIVSYGTQNWGGHKGMNAFFDGDFETAETFFEKEFKKFKRERTAIENAANNAISNEINSTGIETVTSGSIQPSGPGSAAPTQTQSSPLSTVSASGYNSARRDLKTGSNILTDGKVTYEDFAFSKYMAGLSEVELGKYDEAKKSFKTSLSYNSKNHDARLLLGLLYVNEKDFYSAADQLEKLDKQRQQCLKTQCDRAKNITDAAKTLSASILTEIRSQ